jgi:hypothetical protein
MQIGPRERRGAMGTRFSVGGLAIDPRLMAIKRIRTPLRVETLSFGEAAGFIPQR